jgi:hypothetical protein
LGAAGGAAAVRRRASSWRAAIAHDSRDASCHRNNTAVITALTHVDAIQLSCAIRSGSDDTWTTSPNTSTTEPRIDEMLDDAVVKAVMQRDGVGRGELLGLIEWARIELGKRRRQNTIAAMRIGRAA